MRLLTVDACAYCGRKSQGNFAIERDGAFSGSPQVPLCDDCGGHAYPTLQDIWARIAMVDDHGVEWGPTPDPCRDRHQAVTS